MVGRPVDRLATVLVVLVKGVACGFFAGLVYKLFSKIHNVFAVFAAAIICPVVNTGVFLLGCQFFFLETVSAWGAALGYENAAA